MNLKTQNNDFRKIGGGERRGFKKQNHPKLIRTKVRRGKKINMDKRELLKQNWYPSKIAEKI